MSDFGLNLPENCFVPLFECYLGIFQLGHRGLADVLGILNDNSGVGMCGPHCLELEWFGKVLCRWV